MYLLTEGIVLNQSNFREYDKVVTLYTLDKGKIKTIFKSVNKPNAKLLSLTQVGSEVEVYLYYSNDNFLKVVGGKLIDGYFEVKQSYEKYVNLCKILEVVDKLTLDFLPDEKKYFLIKRGISLLKNSSNPALIYTAFVLRWIKLCGYQPEIFRCIRCKKKFDDKIWWFDFLNGGIICKDCIKKDFLSTNENIIEISYYSIKIMQSFYKLSGDNIDKQKIDVKIFSEIEKIIENYLNNYLHSPLKIKT
ncbi:MAG: DNA repair protein RecO [Endomicrobiia bacterium]